MKYSTGVSFRTALEARILELHKKTGIPLTRYRKQIAFERFLARLVYLNRDLLVLKGGFMMELLYHQKARTTKDIDLLFTSKRIDIVQYLFRINAVDLSDWFSFEVAKPKIEKQDKLSTMQFNVKSLLASRTFESFQVDINSGDILLEKPEYIQVSDLLKFAGIEPIQVACYPLPQQIAEKFHALTRKYASGEPSRVKDLVDILLIASAQQISGKKLHKAIIATFTNRNTHPLPKSTPHFSSNYSKNYSSISKEIGLSQKTIEEADRALNLFLLPVILGNPPKIWNPNKWAWE